MKAIIIGGGWAGLAAAVELSRNNISVTVLEAARQLGGRARSIEFNKHHVDNGQHILLGAYTSILSTLDIIGVPESKVLRRQPSYMVMKIPNKKTVSLSTPSLPAPWHLIWALILYKGMRFSHCLRIMRALIKMKQIDFSLTPDIPLSIFLKKTRQPMEAIDCFWEPLCVSILNLPSSQASVNIFMRVIRDAFFQNKEHSDLLLPIADLDSCLPLPAMDYIEKQGGQIQLASRVKQIKISKGAITGVVTSDNEYTADHVIVATTPESCSQLLSEHKMLNDITSNLLQLGSMPITTLYLQYPRSVQLPREFVGFVGTVTQWLFSREQLTGERGLIAAVISGPGDHMKLDAQELTNKIVAEIADQFPHWPEPSQTKLIREKRATIAAVPDSDKLRPNNATNIEGLWLAGDYTATGYPSTLEGAVRSGISCAQQIVNY